MALYITDTKTRPRHFLTLFDPSSSSHPSVVDRPGAITNIKRHPTRKYNQDFLKIKGVAPLLRLVNNTTTKNQK